MIHAWHRLVGHIRLGLYQIMNITGGHYGNTRAAGSAGERVFRLVGFGCGIAPVDGSSSLVIPRVEANREAS